MRRLTSGRSAMHCGYRTDFRFVSAEEFIRIEGMLGEPSDNSSRINSDHDSVLCYYKLSELGKGGVCTATKPPQILQANRASNTGKIV